MKYCTIQQRKRSYFTVAVLSAAFFVVLSFFVIQKIKKPPIQVSLQVRAINFNSQFLKMFSGGYNRLISSVLWIKTLIDSDLEHYNKDDLNSWMYLRFNTITTLSPYFYEAYLFGGQYLSVIKDDDLGAKVLYERGTYYYPDDFWLNFYSGFHHYFELKDNMGALKSYNRIIFHPLTKKHAPYLPSLISKIKAETGDYESAYQALMTAYLNTTNTRIKKWFRKSIYELKAEMDLNCLNSGRSDCNKVDFDGHPYRKDSQGVYQSFYKSDSFKTNRNKKGSK